MYHKPTESPPVCFPIVVRPLHDIAITNIVWCMDKQGRSVGGRILRNGRAIVLR